MSDGRELELVGSCMFIADGTSVNPTGFKTGCVESTSRSGAGVYAVNLQAGYGADNLQHVVHAQVIGGAGNANVQVAWTSDVLLAVTTFVGAVATDEIVKLSILRVRSLSA